MSSRIAILVAFLKIPWKISVGCRVQGTKVSVVAATNEGGTMGEERDLLKENDQDREATRPAQEDPDVEGHRHRPMQEEDKGEGEGPDVEGHMLKGHHKP